MTVLGIYRLIWIPGTLKLHSITEGFVGSDITILIRFTSFIQAHFFNWIPSVAFSLKRPRLWLNLSAGSQGALSALMAPVEACLIYFFHKDLWAFMKLFSKEVYKGSGLDFLVPIYAWILYPWRNGIRRNLPSRLSIKEEAAGKIRLFAIVDYWTQYLLRPLHFAVFEILKAIPQDGTFDQDASVETFREYLEANGLKSVWSFDLSSATDRIPIFLYTAVLEYLLGSEGAQRWKTLLTFRPWQTPNSIPGV